MTTARRVVHQFGGASVLVLGASIAMLAPFVVFRMPPMTDLPEHEMMVAALRSFGDEVRFHPASEASDHQPESYVDTIGCRICLMRRSNP